MDHPRRRQPRTSVASSARCPGRSLLAAALVCVIGCGSPPDADKVRDTVRSWTATVNLAVEEWRAGAITRRYATLIGDHATEARREAAASLAQSGRSGPDRERAQQALVSLDAAIRRLADLEASR
jgi:hypothetical protein